MNNFKSQGQTFEEARVTLDEGIFIEDPFFKDHLENIRKQRELGLGFDMEKAKKVVKDSVSGIDYSGLPEAIRNRTLVIDINQVCAAHGADTAEKRQALKDKISNMPEVRDINLICFDEVNSPKEEFVSFEILKVRSSTGRFDYPFLPDGMPRLNKTYMPPKEGDDVAFTEYNRHALTRGTVKGFSKGMGMVIVEYSHYGETKTTKKTSDYVIKVAK